MNNAKNYWKFQGCAAASNMKDGDADHDLEVNDAYVYNILIF